MPKQISIIIPAYNEENNLEPLFERLDASLNAHNIEYEAIVIDDDSEDNTLNILKRLQKKYPIKIASKIGERGKAQSLLQGFSYAQYPIVGMIDADLQYPPESIPQMLAVLKKNKSDIVIANRSDQKTSFIRRFLSKTFVYLFVQLLHNLKLDAQTGLKVFRKEILDRININPSPWAFDLEFLVKAKDAGYKIETVNIVFSPRHSGEAKINLIQAGIELASSAWKLKIDKNPVVLFNEETLKEKGQGFHYKGLEFVHHTNLHHQETALTRFGGSQIKFITLFVICYVVLLVVNWHLTLLLTLGLITLLYFADLMFNLYLVYKSFKHHPEIKISDNELASIPEVYWPRYTVFCPLYKEWQVVPQFVAAMSKLDYPIDKLQVMLLLEEDDKETIAKTAEFDLPSYFDVVVVPHSMPKTKPKALNYGLSRATGEYIVIYDAEDVPEATQLKKAVLAFDRANKKTICVQAKLNFYNPHQNILTRVFTAEYSLWFDLILPGIQSIDGPIPLGGTSNHFKKKDVIKLKGWDAFNVTEDADLGIRLAKQGYQTVMIDSTTLEEANSKFWNWYSQRSRWIKGYIQTYLVHMRRPKHFLKNNKHFHLFAFQFIVGGKVLSMFINPVMWLITIVYFAFRPILGEFIDSFFPSTILYIGVASFIMGNFLYLYYYMIGCAKRGHFDLIKYVFLVPFYWLMMSFASWRAIYEMIVKPHYWAKTLHGLHLTSDRGSTQAKLFVGSEVIDA